MSVPDPADSIDFFGIWRVELERFKIPYETNITVAEVIADNIDQAQETALNAIYFNNKTARELGATVRKIWFKEIN